MKKLILIVILILLFPFIVKAETKTYEICQDGCEFDRLAPVLIDINLLKEEYDVVINFKDEGPYYLIKDEQDYYTLLSKIEEECINNNGTWDGYDCIDSNSLEIGTLTMFFNPKLKSLTINGVENKTEIYPTGVFSMSEFLNALTFAGILQTNFELNNLYLASSVYFTAVTKDVEGTINNCDIKHGILAFGNEHIVIKNSKINNVYIIGKDFAKENMLVEENPSLYKDLKNPIIIIDKETTTFYKKYYKYTEKSLMESFAELREFYDNNPEPKYSEPYPILEDFLTDEEWKNAVTTYWNNERQWRIDHINEIIEWNNAKKEIVDRISERFYQDKVGKTMEETILELLDTMVNNDQTLQESYNSFEEKYLQENPMPEIGTDEYDIWYKEHQEALEHYLIDGSLLPTSGDLLLKLLNMIIFPGDDGSFSNVIELSGGKIYLGSSGYRKIQVEEKTNIKDLMTEPILDIEIPENEVIKIEKSTIIPLKPGEVTIVIKTENEILNLTIEVVAGEVLNPNTKRGITSLIIVVLIASAILFLITNSKRKGLE